MKKPSVILNTQGGQWILASHNGYWHIPFTSDAAALLGFLHVSLEDDLSRLSDFSISGKAYHYSTEGKICTIEIVIDTALDETAYKKLDFPEKDVSDPKKIYVDLEYDLDKDENSGSISFQEGLYSDAWISTKAVFNLHNVLTMGLRFNLPGRDDLQDKSLIFEVDGEVHQMHKLQRDTIEEVWLDFDHTPKFDSQLVVKSSYREPNANDERALGVSLIALNINLTGWQSPRELSGERCDD